MNFTGATRTATLANGTLPGPILRWREGDDVTLRVRNQLRVDTAIHWHGVLTPANMDGVPGMSFHGIAPGESFDYRFRARQSGTYWYHAHADFQEQTGVYGAIVIEPREPEPFNYDREHVVSCSPTGPIAIRLTSIDFSSATRTTSTTTSARSATSCATASATASATRWRIASRGRGCG